MFLFVNCCLDVPLSKRVKTEETTVKMEEESSSEEDVPLSKVNEKKYQQRYQTNDNDRQTMPTFRV